MFENMRIGSLYPPGFTNQPDPMAEFNAYIAPQLRARQSQEDMINANILQHLPQGKPINRYSTEGGTTNHLVSQGLTPANTQVNTVAAPDTISPLDKMKLMQGQEKINLSQSKETTDSGIKQQRADIYDYKSKHPDHKFDFSGPTVKVADPKTGTVYDSGLDTGKLSMEDKLKLSSNLDTSRDINRIQTQGNVNLNRDMGKHEDTLSEIAARGNETRKTNTAKPNTKTTSNTQVNQGYLNKANELLNSHPEYAPYIKLGKSDNGKINGFTIEAPNGGDDPNYHEINKQIYGGLGDVNIPSSGNSSNNSSFSSSTTKAYQDKNGNKYNIPMDKITQFLKDNPDAQEVK